MESREIVNRACEKEIYAIVRLGLHALTKRAPAPWLLRISGSLSDLLLASAPEVQSATTDALRACFPEATLEDTRRNLAHVLLNMAYLPTVVRMSPQDLEALVDSSELERALDLAGDRPTLFVPAHFYNNLVFAVFADALYRRARPLHSTLFLDESTRLPSFMNACKRRFHTDFHVPMNLSRRRVGAARVLCDVLARPRGAALVFGDIRLRKQPTDVGFSVGSATLYADGGVKTLIERAPREAAVVPCFLTMRGASFVLECPEVLSPDDALCALYDRLLPDYLSRYRHQWQLWYLAGGLLFGSGSR